MGALKRVRDVASGEAKATPESPVLSVEPGGTPTIVLGDFKLIREIGHGAMGTVYEAEQISLHRQIALKILATHLSLSPAAVQKFQREAEAAARQRHPGIVAIHAVGRCGSVYYIAQELVAGGRSLVHWLDDRRHEDELPRGYFRDVARLAVQVAEALHHTHESGVIHRDVKPSNILITEAGQTKLTDFGLARVEDALALSRTGDFSGSPFYMSPEQAASRRIGIDHRTDIFSLGVTLYEMLALERPFQGDTMQDVLKKILLQEPRDPRKVNPGVPRDLALISLKAMEKNPDDRYSSMQDLADDLGRFLSGDVIHARAAAPITVVRKWARRNPAKVVGITAVVLILVAAVGLLIGLKLAREYAVAGHLVEARKQIAASNFSEALKEVARALENDRDSAEAARLEAEVKNAAEKAGAEDRKRDAFSAASAARAEAKKKASNCDETREQVALLQKKVQRDRQKCMMAYATVTERAEFARKEKQLAGEESRLDRLLAERREALERAFRLEAPYLHGEASADTRAALADLFLERFRDALASGDLDRAGRLAEEVRRYDDVGVHARELLGRGTLTVAVDPREAEVYLFRYESYESVRTSPAVVPRLVPVPTKGIGRCRPGPWLEKEGFFPGDLCLFITSVTKDSIAARSGLLPGDLVLRLNGQPCGDGLFVTEVDAEGPLARAGVRPLARIVSLNGEEVEVVWDWKCADRSKDGPDRVRFARVEREVRCDRRTVRFAPAVDVVRGRAPVAMSLRCLSRGVAVTVSVPRGDCAGVAVEVTAYPMILSPENRIPAGKAIDVDPGSYLLLVRSPGREDQRFPVEVGRGGRSVANVTLLEIGATPPGFVYVPPGPFIYGGDPEVRQIAPQKIFDLPGFFISRKEVTYREWFEFLGSPWARKLIESAKGETPTRRILVPRSTSTFYTDPVEMYGTRIELKKGTLDTPVVGISWEDIQDYLKWRNRKACDSGESVQVDLPTAEQWEKAARGVDGRFFPWGNRLDFTLANSAFRKKTGMWWVAGGYEPRDESPYGVLDTAGSVVEMTGTESPPGSEQIVVRGSHRGEDEIGEYRIVYRDDIDHMEVVMSVGFRLVIRRTR